MKTEIQETSMTGQNIGIVLVRLFSIYLAITSLQSLFLYLPSYFQPVMNISDWIMSIGFWLSAVAVLLPAVCAFWIWRNADTIVPEQAVTDESLISSAQLMLVGLSLLGLYFFVWGVVSLVRVESGLAAADELDSATKWAQRAPYVAQILIAVPMLFGRRRLAELLLMVKYAATDRA